MLDLVLAGVLAAGGYDAGRVLCALSDDRIDESSGLVVGQRSDRLFTHNDSGDSGRFFALDRSCRTQATYTLTGVEARDWEDVARGPGQTLWFADIGDNSESRDGGVLVHRVREPDDGTPETVTATSYRLRYEDGPHDAETLIVQPSDGRLLIITKTLGSRAGVYASDQPLRAGGAANILRLVAEIAIPLATAGDISPDGSRVAVRNGVAAYEWDVSGGDVVEALAAEPVRIPLPASEQGESLTYDRDGRSLLVGSEGVGAAVHVLGSAPAPAAAPADQRRTWRVPIPAVAGATAVIGLALLAGLRRRRRG